MEEIQIVVDLDAMHHTYTPSESMQLEASPLSEPSLQRELDTLWANTDEAKKFTIFRTPHNIPESKKNFFKPSAVSIGPFHHGQKHLQALEEQKRRFLQDFLSRENNLSLDLCISEMKKLETRTRKCYNETFNDLDSNAFVKMMLLDGCFVLEIKGLLTKIFACSKSQSKSVSLPNSTRNISSLAIPSATELKQKGVKFAPKINPKHMLDISFESGVLKIPRLQIGDETKPIFANLMAFEHSKYGQKQSPFTRFVLILDDLVSTPHDVEILQECGIIENWLGSKMELADFLNQA
ncbi:uncharacterized protein LOC144563632 [Carex rostrata]